tara:strand:+ start:183 stop:362 length:180 start_codon:yes stop_codon:yes gene_type:complete
MKEVFIQLSKDDALSVKRGNQIVYFFEDTKVVVKGPPPVKKPKKGRPRKEPVFTDIKLT